MDHSLAIAHQAFENSREVTLKDIVKVWPPMEDGPRRVGQLPALAVYRALGTAAGSRARRAAPPRHHGGHVRDN